MRGSAPRQDHNHPVWSCTQKHVHFEGRPQRTGATVHDVTETEFQDRQADIVYFSTHSFIFSQRRQRTDRTKHSKRFSRATKERRRVQMTHGSTSNTAGDAPTQAEIRLEATGAVWGRSSRPPAMGRERRVLVICKRDGIREKKWGGFWTCVQGGCRQLGFYV